MKKIILSISATLLLGSNTVHAENSGFYIGGGYAYTTVDFSTTIGGFELPSFDATTDSIVLLAGFDINDYLGVEARYYWNITSGLKYEYNYFGLLDDYKAESFVVYAKPQINFDLIALYALLGFTLNNYTALNQSGDDTLFSWGGGIRVGLTDSFGAFVDYTDLGESDILFTAGLSSWNFGLSYKF